MSLPAVDYRSEPPGSLRGRLFNIQFHSTEDGPGIRTTFFFKGCHMRCPWCHNPEGMHTHPELIWYENRCIGASDCLQACPRKALRLTPQGMRIDRDRCDGCGICESACPAGALEVVGKDYSVPDLVSLALQDKVFYQKSGGGITLSGGEPSLQADFCGALMDALKEQGLHLALDTCGGTSWTVLERLVRSADLILYDLKIMDPDQHRRYTGLLLKPVLENAQRIAEIGKPLWIRTPIIPGINDTEENIRRTARFIQEKLPTVARYDLLAFNNTCSSKYHRLGRSWDLGQKELISEETLERLAEAARREGLAGVHRSGLTKPAESNRS